MGISIGHIEEQTGVHVGSQIWRGQSARRRVLVVVGGGLPWWKESPLMEAGSGRKAEPTVTEDGESEGNPSRAELNLQDDQLRLRGAR